MASGFGSLPMIDNLSAADMADLLQRLNIGQQDQRDSGMQPGTQGQPPQVGPVGLGDLLGGAGHSAPPVAMSEADAQRLERQQAGPQDLAALGGSPVDRLLFDRSGMGGGANGFTGTSGATLPDAFASRPTPLPPARPSDADLMVQPAATGSVSGMNPAPPPPGGRPPARDAEYGRGVTDSAGTPSAAQMMPVNSFDPLTGQPVSGAPRPIGGQQAPASPFGGNPAVPASAPSASPQQSMLERYARGIGNPDLSNLLLNVGIGLMTHRGFGEGVGAGLQGFQSSQAGSTKQLLEQYKLMNEIQGQNATRADLKRRGVPASQIEAAVYNPAILQSTLAGLDRQPQTFQFGGNTYLGRADQPRETWQLLGPSGVPLDQEVKKADALASVADAHAKDEIVLQPDGQGGTIAVRKSSLFSDKASGEGGGPGAPGGDPNIRTIVPPQPDKKANEGLDKLIGDNITAGYSKAQGAVGTLAAISRQKEALDKGVIAGSGADWRTQAQAIGAQLLGIDPSQLNASYSFDAASTQKQAELAKAVSQAGHTTNMDLQLGKTIAGGDRSKTEQALRQIVDAQEQLARDAIDRHNAALDKYAKIAPEAAARTGFFRVETPEIYRYGQATPNPLADPGTRLPTNAPGPLDVGGSRQFQGITIKRVR